MLWKSRKVLSQERLKKRYEQEDIALFKNRLKRIKAITDANLLKAQCGKPFPIRSNVVISCDDLLEIWDIASRLEDETPVHGK